MLQINFVSMILNFYLFAFASSSTPLRKIFEHLTCYQIHIELINDNDDDDDYDNNVDDNEYDDYDIYVCYLTCHNSYCRLYGPFIPIPYFTCPHIIDDNDNDNDK
jgi:hypothetical protein